MIHFFLSQSQAIFVLQTDKELSPDDITKLEWLFGSAKISQEAALSGFFVGPRAAMITPWSTNAVEITQNMDIQGIIRIEEFKAVAEDFSDYDPMLSQKYDKLDQNIYTINIKPEPILEITDIAAYNKQEGLSLSDEEVEYLNNLAKNLERPLTDSEVFGFSQVNSEHCRHKI
ncbi:MAG: phosphoribosylformylglycinamidine synthase, partial [Sphingobacteriales bacterium]